MSNADFVSRKLTFSWSIVSTDCVALIHYNIQASNCGSCPTITNHTNATCTEVPTNVTTCMFAIQTVVCGNITWSVEIITNNTFHHNMGTDSLSTDTAYIISISSLATALIVCTAVCLTVMIIMSIRNRARNKAATEFHLLKRGSRTTQADSMCEDVTTPLLPVGTISTQDSVAYGNNNNDCS